MKEDVYYFVTSSGEFHFSTGITRPDYRAGQYIRMLSYAGYPLHKLYLDIPEDYEKIQQIFHIPDNTPWQTIYNQ